MTDRLSSAPTDGGSTDNRRSLGCLGALVALALIVALFGAFVFYRTSGLVGAGAEKLVRDAFVAVARLQPKVTVDEHVVFEQTSPVLELATVERDVSVERKTTDTWLGSTKRVRLRAVYHVKAGFDLRQPFDVRLEGGRIAAHLPPARLLSAEQVRLERLDVDNGMWNLVADDELKAELNTLNVEARLKALQAGLPREAEAMLARQLREKLGPDHPIAISFSPEATAVPATSPLP